MGSLWIANHPDWSKSDLNKVQLFRERHDELYYGTVEPHFTLVFPDFDKSVDRDQFVDHAKRVVSEFSEFEATLSETAVVEDHFKPYWHLFLVPAKDSEGYRRLVELHDALYSGPLNSLLRSDIPYIPHIGVANSRSREQCVALAASAQEMLPMQIKVKSVEISWFDGASDQLVELLPLKEA